VTVTIRDKGDTVYIYGCVGATINVTGKCKSIVVDGCKKTKVGFINTLTHTHTHTHTHIHTHTITTTITTTTGIRRTLSSWHTHTHIHTHTHTNA